MVNATALWRARFEFGGEAPEAGQAPGTFLGGPIERGKKSKVRLGCRPRSAIGNILQGLLF